MSSQSAEDGFSEGPWRTLMEELGEEGQQLLPNFSISNNLNKVWRSAVCIHPTYGASTANIHLAVNGKRNAGLQFGLYVNKHC